MERLRPGVRIPALDGLRGLLALVVLTYHITFCLGTNALGNCATFAVCCFFVISGYVLTPAFDGRYASFLARRAVRLWPVYAVGLFAGATVQKHMFPLPVLAWFPGLDLHAGMTALLCNPPAWSLCVEAWAMPFIPFIAWFGRGSLWRVALIPPLWLAAWHIPGPVFWLGFFMTGAALSRFEFRCWPLETRVPQWLGKVSYSLYLIHMPVLSGLLVAFGRPGVVAGVPFVFAVSLLVWRYVERPSIELSRKVGRRPQKVRQERPGLCPGPAGA
jgi:peptidoglycan/LPS O-acetylase OafA/YrhL